MHRITKIQVFLKKIMTEIPNIVVLACSRVSSFRFGMTSQFETLMCNGCQCSICYFFII